MEYNSKIVKDGLSSLKFCLERFRSEIEFQLNVLNVKVVVEDTSLKLIML